MSSNKENLRISLPYKDTSQKFVLGSNDFQPDLYYRQYFVVYRTRIDSMYDRLLKQAQKEFGQDFQPTPLDKLVYNKKAFIAGIVIKKSKQRPSVLTEFEMPNFRSEEEEEHEEATKYSIYDSVCSAEDQIELESTEQRLSLVGNIDKNDFVTGFVIGLYGAKDDKENFVVDKIIFPELAPQIEWPLEIEESYVMFISGIGLDSDLTRNESTCLALAQLFDWICGSGGSDEDLELVRRVSRLVIAGDSVHISSRDINEYQITKIGQKTNFDPTPLEQLDRILENFIRTIPVDVMSGPNDICDPMMPQQPMIVRAFDRCHRYGVEMFNVATNPYSFELGGLQFLGTSGQNLHDLLKYTKGHTQLELMRYFLERSHLAPTCPDTIDGFPLTNKDPFIVDSLPHIFFAGNQTDHQLEKYTFDNGAKTVLMTIPRFCEKREVVLLNLKTLDSRVLRFEQMLTS